MTDRATYEVTAVRYGTRSTTKSECFLDYASYGEPDARIAMDYFFWILRRGEEIVLVDTGFDPEVGARRVRTCLHEPLAALARLGVEPESVSRVVLTHLHYDHVGNVSAFPHAELVVQERELEFEFWSGPRGPGPSHAVHVEPGEIAEIVRAHRDGRVRLVRDREVICPGVTAIRVGGHSPGQLVLVVDAAAGPVVLASDALHYYEELELDRPFEIVVDVDEMLRGYATLRSLSEEPGALLVAGHDPAVLERFPALAGASEGLGVRIA